MRRARRAALAACGPGGTLEEVHGAACRAISEGLVGMGVVLGSAEEVLAEKHHRAFYPHQTSHWLGLDTHDPGLYRDSGRAGAAGAGDGLHRGARAVFRAGELPAACRSWKGTGIRIEDDVLITEEGAEVLTAGLPTDLGTE